PLVQNRSRDRKPTFFGGAGSPREQGTRLSIIPENALPCVSRSMIDVHPPLVPPQLPGAGPLRPPRPQPGGVLAEPLRREMEAAGIQQAFAMGAAACTPDDPLGIAGTLRVAGAVPGLHAIGVMDPTRGEAEHLRRVDAALAAGQARALKGYLG